MKFLPMKVDDETLIALFFESDRTTRELAEREGITPQSLMVAWKRLRQQGHLPPARHDHNGLRPQGQAAPRPQGETENYDGRPRVGLSADDDPLLARLREAHPEKCPESPASPNLQGFRA